MQWVFIKKLYNFYKTSSSSIIRRWVFCWFANVQLTIGRGAEIDEWRVRGLFRGKVWARVGRRGRVMRHLSCPEEL